MKNNQQGQQQPAIVASGDRPVGIAPCENCGQPSHKRCNRCRAFSVCRQACMVAVWPKHKADCKNVVNARRQLELAGKTVSGVPCSIGAETLARLNRLSLFVYDKYDITEPPGRGSKMDVDKKLAFFLEMLKAHDTSSSENKNLPLPEKLFLNRRYNNTYNHIGETFTPSELARFHALMRVHHVGLSNQS